MLNPRLLLKNNIHASVKFSVTFLDGHLQVTAVGKRFRWHLVSTMSTTVRAKSRVSSPSKASFVRGEFILEIKAWPLYLSIMLILPRKNCSGQSLDHDLIKLYKFPNSPPVCYIWPIWMLSICSTYMFNYDLTRIWPCGHNNDFKFNNGGRLL